MDEKDLRIITAIAELGTNSPDRIHRATDIPKSTVHYRIEKLQERDVLENDILDVNLDAVGLTLTLVTQVWAEYSENYHQHVGDELAALEGVNQVYFTLGETDFVLVSHLASHEMVEELVTKFEGIDEIVRTDSKFVISRLKNERNPLNDYEYETLVETLLEE